LLTRFRNAERAQPGLARAELVRQEAGQQIGPTLGAAVLVALAFLPFVLVGAVAGTEIVGPMAGVILGGVVSLCLVNLLALPAAYLWCLGGRRERIDERGADTSVAKESALTPVTVGPARHEALNLRRGRPGEAPV
jgi:Cu/Ag efflux pump CusA